METHDVFAFQLVPLQKQVTRQSTSKTTPLGIRKVTETTIKPPTTATLSTTALHGFGNIFGWGGSSSKVSLNEPVLVYTHSFDQLEFDGLCEYVEKWANLFTTGNIKLTTPVTVVKVSNENSRGVRLLFQNTNTRYQSKSDEKEAADVDPTTSQDDTSRKSKKKEATKQGGVEILVDKSTSSIQVVASRCEIDEDTIIKEMSEETIIHELKQAIEVWKRDKP